MKELVSVTLGNGITELGDYAFTGCKSLEVIQLGENITTIGSEAFRDNESLKSIDIPDSVSLIENNAFFGCRSLEIINIGSNLTQIGNYYSLNGYIEGAWDIFLGTRSLKSINVNENNEVYCSVDGVLYSKDMTKLIKYPAGKTDASFEIPNSVTTVCAYAFNSCSGNNLKIIVPYSVTTCESYCFDNSITVVCSKDSIAGEYAKNNEISYKYN